MLYYFCAKTFSLCILSLLYKATSTDHCYNDVDFKFVSNYTTNSMRTFLYKLHHNLLGLNSRVANFVRNHPRTCTFCDIIRIREENPETTKHLFFECNIVEDCLRGFFNWCFNNAIVIGSREFFVGTSFENENKNKTMDIVLCIAKKIIWECKLRFCIPTVEIFKKCFLWEIKIMYKNSKFVRDCVTKSDLFLNHQEIRF